MSDNAQSVVLVDFLLKRYGDLKRRLTRLLGSDELASDALQDTWLRLQRTSEKNPILDPQAFLLRMAANIAVDQHRSQSRALPQNEIDALLDLPDPSPNPEQSVLMRAEMDLLFHAMERLPKRRREILILVRWEGIAQKEVAEMLGISLRTVEHELKRAHDFCLKNMQSDY